MFIVLHSDFFACNTIMFKWMRVFSAFAECKTETTGYFTWSFKWVNKKTKSFNSRYLHTWHMFTTHELYMYLMFNYLCRLIILFTVCSPITSHTSHPHCSSPSVVFIYSWPTRSLHIHHTIFIYQGSNARNMATRKECFLLKLHELLPAHVSPYTLFEIIKQWTLVIDYTVKLNCSTASLKIINTQLPAVVCKYI